MGLQEGERHPVAPSDARHERLREYLKFRVRPPKKRLPRTPEEPPQGFTLKARLRFSMIFIVLIYVIFALTYAFYELWLEPKMRMAKNGGLNITESPTEATSVDVPASDGDKANFELTAHPFDYWR